MNSNSLDIVSIIEYIQIEICSQIPEINKGGCGVFAYKFFSKIYSPFLSNLFEIELIGTSQWDTPSGEKAPEHIIIKLIPKFPNQFYSLPWGDLECIYFDSEYIWDFYKEAKYPIPLDVFFPLVKDENLWNSSFNRRKNIKVLNKIYNKASNILNETAKI